MNCNGYADNDAPRTVSGREKNKSWEELMTPAFLQILQFMWDRQYHHQLPGEP
jgi:hypothetical protein